TCFGRALGFENVKTLVNAVIAPLFELIVEVSERIDHPTSVYRQLAVAARKMDQGISLCDARTRHFAYKNIMVAGGDSLQDFAFDRRECARDQRHSTLAAFPRDSVEAVLAFSRKTVGKVLLFLGQNTDAEELSGPEVVDHCDRMTQADQNERRRKRN